MTTSDVLDKEIERMAELYEIVELSEESGLQEQFEQDIKKLIAETRKETIDEMLKYMKKRNEHIKELKINRIGLELNCIVAIAENEKTIDKLEALKSQGAEVKDA